MILKFPGRLRPQVKWEPPLPALTVQDFPVEVEKMKLEDYPGWIELLDAYLDLEIRKVDIGYLPENEEDKKWLAELQGKRIKELFRGLNQAATQLSEKYSDQLEDEGKWPRKGMRRDVGIAKMLARTSYQDETGKPRNRFGDIMTFLWDRATGKQTVELAGLIPPEKTIIEQTDGGGVIRKRELVLLSLDSERAAKKLGMPEKTFQKWITEFSKLGIIRKVGRPGKNEKTIWAIGFWLPGKIRRRRPFLIDTPEWRVKLRNFKF